MFNHARTEFVINSNYEDGDKWFDNIYAFLNMRFIYLARNWCNIYQAPSLYNDFATNK